MIRDAAFRAVTAAALFAVLATSAFAATPATLVRDIRRQPGPNLSSSPMSMISLGERALFWARTPQLGMEPYLTDGTAAGTSLLMDLCPGPCDSVGFQPPVAIGGRAYFLASDGARGIELWSTNGTGPGTRSFVDLGPGPAEGFYLFLLDGGDRVLFGALSPSLDALDLWSSDGSPSGTAPFARLSRLTPGDITVPAGAGAPRPMPGGRRLFLRNVTIHGIEQIWETDGTAAGTRPDLTVDQEAGDEVCSTGPDLPRVEREGAFIAASMSGTGCELWRVANGGAAPIANLAPGGRGSFPRGFLQLGGVTLFSARVPGIGEELWRTDGSPQGTVLLGDANPGRGGSAPSLLGRLGDRWVFALGDASAGREPWVTDGTVGSLHRLADLEPGPASSDPQPAGPAGGRLFFWTGVETSRAALRAVDGDGTVATLAEVEAPGGSAGFAAAGTLGLFGADLRDGHGAELGRSDGTPEGTGHLADLATGDPSSGPNQILSVAGRLLFTATDDTHGREVWRSDGTTAGTRLVADLAPGSDPDPATIPSFLAPTASGVVLEAPDGSIRHVRGTGGGIDFLFRPAGEFRGSGRGFRLGSSSLVFVPAGSLENPRFELWRSDGRRNGNRPLADIAGFDRSFGYRVVSAVDAERRRAFFIPVVADPDFGPQNEGLWVSDGTAAGTRLALADPCGLCSGDISEGIVGPGGRFFYVSDEFREDVSALWASDGTSAGTEKLAESPGRVDGDPIRSLARLGGSILFAASDPDHGQELWVSDGTAGGTRLLADLRPGPAPSWPDEITTVGGRAYFSADDGRVGRELWATDGTVEGTYRVADLRQGARSSAPQSLAAIGDRLVFAAADDRHGLEVWSSDGTAAGTRLASDVQVGRLPSSPSDFVVLGSDLLFVASRLGTGRELFRLPLTALEAPR